MYKKRFKKITGSKKLSRLGTLIHIQTQAGTTHSMMAYRVQSPTFGNKNIKGGSIVLEHVQKGSECLVESPAERDPGR